MYFYGNHSVLIRKLKSIHSCSNYAQTRPYSVLLGHRQRRHASSSSVEDERHESSDRRRDRNKEDVGGREEMAAKVSVKASSGDVISLSIEETK